MRVPLEDEETERALERLKLTSQELEETFRVIYAAILAGELTEEELEKDLSDYFAEIRARAKEELKD